MSEPQESSRAITLAGRTLIAVLAVSIGVSSPGAAGPPDREASGETDVEEIGPRAAAVHPGYSTPERARRTVKESHGHGHHAGGAGARGTAEAAPSLATSSVTLVTSTTPTATVTLDPAVHGTWRTLSYRLPLRAIHATALKNGKVLLIAGSGNAASDNTIGSFKAYVLDPDSGALTSVPVPYDAFCSFHLVDADGNVLVFGGTAKYKTATTPWSGSNKVYKFVVDTNTWVAMPSMLDGRWYGGGVMDGKKRFFAYSGYTATGATSVKPEMYDPVTRRWTRVGGRTLPLYPGLLLAADGRVLYTGSHYGSTHGTAAPKLFKPVTGESVLVDRKGLDLDLTHRKLAMTALVGSADRQLAWVAGGGFPAVDTSYFIDMTTATPTAVVGPRLPAPKAYVSLSTLPDLTTLETGGGTGTTSPVYETSILDPSTRRLTSMAPPSVPRTYHSASLTTRDGRVLTFGGDPGGTSQFVLDVEVFSPPYLFRGPRPTISSAPTSVGYGASYTLGAAASGALLHYATLLRPGSATHSMDSDQRVLRLATTRVTGGVRVTMPTNTNLATPGWYMLTVVDSLGRPSVSKMVKLG